MKLQEKDYLKDFHFSTYREYTWRREGLTVMQY